MTSPFPGLDKLRRRAICSGQEGPATGPPGKSERHIIYAHCVAFKKVFGPAGPAIPFQILTHSEDRKGASVRSILPSGYMTTTVELSEDRQEILFHRAKAVGNDPNDRACR